jgi:hypothetical protein
VITKSAPLGSTRTSAGSGIFSGIQPKSLLLGLVLGVLGFGGVATFGPAPVFPVESQGNKLPVLAQHEANEEGRLEQMSSAVREMEHRLERLAGALESPSKTRDASGATVGGMAQASEQLLVERKPSMSLEEAEARDRIIVEAALVSMEAALAATSPDRNEEAKVQRTVQDSFVEAGVSEASIDELKCSGELCKIAIRHETEEDRTAFWKNHGLRVEPFLSNLFFHYEAETQRTVVYVSRNGHALPEVLTDE